MHVNGKRDIERGNSPLLGRDNRFFACLSGCVDLSFGLLWDLRPIPGLELASSTGSSLGLGLGLASSVLDASCIPAELLGEEPQPSEWEGPIFWLERFDWRFDAIGFLPADFKWDLVPFLPSVDPFSFTITPSLRLMSRRRFSQGRTAIHLSNQFQPQLLLSGSNPEGATCSLDPACHCKNRNRSYMYACKVNWYLQKKGLYSTHTDAHKYTGGGFLCVYIKCPSQASIPNL